MEPPDMTDADTEGFARKPDWPRAIAPHGFHGGTGLKKTLPTRVAVVYH
jgi:hypothetical protein